MLKIFLKNALINGLGFGFMSAIMDILFKGKIDYLEVLLGILIFGFLISLLFMYQLKKELKRKGIDQISEAEILDIHKNTFVPKLTFKEVEERIDSSKLKYISKLKESEGKMCIAPMSEYSEWGDPIILESSDGEDKFKLVAKSGWFSPDLYFYKNAINMREIKEILTN